MKKNYFYSAFGLTWECEFPLNEFYKTSNNECDVRIAFSKTPESINYTRKGKTCLLNDNELLLRFENIATYYVANGDTILIEKNETASIKDVRSLLLTTIVGVILNQRRYFPVHGSAVLINKKAIIFSGIAGVGKSTLAAAFALRGYKIIADDISAIELRNDIPLVLPSYTTIKLWPDSISKLKMPEEKFISIRNGVNKKKLIRRKYFEKNKVEVTHIFIIKTSNDKNITIYEKTGLDKFNFLKNSLYRLKMIDGNENKRDLFNYLSIISKKVKLFELTRPKYPFELDSLIDRIKETVFN